jgi:hypothetical protein
MWSVKWGIFSSGYIPKNASELLAHTYFYSDPKKDVMKAYQYTLSLEISEAQHSTMICNFSARLVESSSYRACSSSSGWRKVSLPVRNCCECIEFYISL